MDFIISRRGSWAHLSQVGKAPLDSIRVRTSQTCCRLAMQLLLAAEVGCARPPAASSHGTVEVSLTAAEAAGTPQRVHGELTFSGVDNGLVRSASTQSVGAREVLEFQLPAGRYTLGLDTEAFVAGLNPCAPAAPTRTDAWLHPGRPPLLRVTEGQVTRVRFELVAAEPSRSRAGKEPESAPDHRTGRLGQASSCSSPRGSADADTHARHGWSVPSPETATCPAIGLQQRYQTCQLAKSYLP